MVDLSAQGFGATNQTTPPTPRLASLSCWLSLMLTTTALLLWKLVAVFLIVIAALDLLTMSQERRIRLYKLQGLSQKSIADRLGISRYAVRKALAH